VRHGKVAGRYVFSIAIWAFVLFMNYRLAQHSVLPITESLWLPSFAFPIGMIVVATGFLASGLLARSREAELFDTAATISVTSPWSVRFARLFFALTMISSGLYAVLGRHRTDLMYSTPGWGWAWIALGAFSLFQVATFRRIRVEVSPTGIRHPQIRPADVAWEDVAEIKSKRWFLSSFVLVIFRDGAQFRLSAPLWRWRKVKQIMFTPTFFGVDAETLANALKIRRDLRAF
jgi:hypothetical protein